MNQPLMTVDIDADHGGRWTSLRGRNGREWLWRRDAPERDAVRPGDPFVDAGGLEECLPYRSIGVEPMLGYSPTLALAQDGDAAVVPSPGTIEWSLTIDG